MLTCSCAVSYTDLTLTSPVSFTSLQLNPSLQRGLKDLGFLRPTPIQSEAIPPALEGRDILACAMTGSGKTYAFLLPIMHQLLEKPRGVTRALVLTPTRELAAQILESLNDVAVHTPLTGAAVFGGVGMGPQEHAFRTGVDVMVATPGRLLDHFRSPYAKLDQLEYLVLDEADRMLDMGFLPEIKKILRHLPSRKRQTLFFSATMPAPIAVGIDAKDGFVAVKGWTEASRQPALALARDVAALGVAAIIYTDIATDGMMAGPNFGALDALLAAVDCPVIASGGVSRPADLIELSRRPGLTGAIIGRALYDGAVKLGEFPR